MNKPLVLILGTAEWNAPIATNQHYVTRELAREFSVVFAEGVGTRSPTFSKNDLKRMAARLQKLFRRGANVDSSAASGDHTCSFVRPIPDSVDVVSPFAVPFHTKAMVPVNRRLLTRSFAQWIEHDGPKILWSYTPFTYGLETHADVVVYHLVDLLHENPGASRVNIFRGERLLAKSTHLAIATAPAIGEHLHAQGFASVDVKLNVADVAVFEKARGVAKDEPSVVVFAGNLRADKLDVELLHTLAVALLGKAVLRLIGPSGLEPGERSFLDELQSAGVDVRPALSIDELAIEIAKARVGIIPYRVNALTRGISPLKTYEYLAAGVPVVSTSLPSMATPVDGVTIADGSAFVDAVLHALDASNEMITVDARNSWRGRGEELRALLRTRLD